MKKHKWKSISNTLNQRVDECTKCGLERTWFLGDYQCWCYYFPVYGYGMVRKEMFQRPDCKEKANSLIQQDKA